MADPCPGRPPPAAALTPAPPPTWASAWAPTLAAPVALAFAGQQAVAAGWLARHWPAPELQGLTGLCLAVAAAAAAWAAGWRARRANQAMPGPAASGLAALALLLAAALALLGPSPVIGAARPLQPWTGAALLFALAVLAVAQLPVPARWQRRWPVPMLLALSAAWGLWLVAVGLLVPAALLLDGLPLEGGLSWPSVLVLGLLGVAATAQVRSQPALRSFFHQREDRRILAISLLLLLVTALLAVVLVSAALTVRTVDGLRPVLQRGAATQGLALDQLLARVTEASAADAQVLLRAAATPAATPLRTSGMPGADTLAVDTPALLRALRQTLDPLGRAGVQLRRDGRVLATEGALDNGTWLTLPGHADHRVALAHHPHGLVLRVLRQSEAGAELEVQVRPFQAGAELVATELFGPTSELFLCTDAQPQGARCLSAARPAGFVMPLPPRPDAAPWPVQRAWRGERGVDLLRDPLGAAAAVAYAPVGLHGVAVVQKVALAPLIHKVSDAALPALLAVLALIPVGGWWMYRRIFPPLHDLRYAKAQVQATLAHLPLGVLTLAADGTVLSCNAGACQLLGLPEHEVVGGDVARWLEATATDTAAPRTWADSDGTHEAWLQAGDGPRITVAATVRPFDFAGQPRRLVILRDLRAELAQRDELARWERIFRHADWGVVTSSADGRHLDLMNPAFARMHGYTVAELRGQLVTVLFASQALPALHDQLHLANTRGHHRFESWHRRRDGSVFPVLVDLTVVRDATGDVAMRVVNVQDMTEHKQAEAAVRRSEALLQQVLKTLPVGIFISDREGRVMLCNPAVETLWRGPVLLQDGRPTSRRVWRVADGRQSVLDEAPTMRAIRSGQATPPELFEVEAPDGSRATLMITAVPMIGPQGEVEGAISVSEDFTVMQRAEAATFAAKTFFEGLFESAAVGMAVWDAQGRFVRVNRALCELLCRSSDAMLAGTLHDVGDPAQVDVDLRAIATLSDAGRDKFQAERRWRRCDGRPVWLMMVVSLLRLPGSPQAQYVAQLVDIDRSHRIQQALQASEARLRNAHRIARLADWEWCFDDDQLHLSAQGGQVLGLPDPAAAPATLDAWLAHVHPADRLQLVAALHGAAAGCTALALDYRWLPGDGRTLVLHQQGEWTAGDDAGPARLLGVLQDITDRKQIEYELLRSHERLRALSANAEAMIENERRHIAREVHDELGQALTALKMELSLLLRRFGAGAALAAHVERMSGMVDDTLGVVRHVTSNLRPPALDYGLVAAIEWLAEDFSHRWEIPCTLQCDGPDIKLSDAHATALFRIVQESLTNVARHAQAGAVQIHLRVARGRLALRVHDDGKGFDTAAAQDSGRFGLLGMRERALQIGAQLQVHSSPGRGTTVELDMATQES